MGRKRKYHLIYELEVGKKAIYREREISIGSLLNLLRKLEKEQNRGYEYEYINNKIYITREK